MLQQKYTIVCKVASKSIYIAPSPFIVHYNISIVTKHVRQSIQKAAMEKSEVVSLFKMDYIIVKNKMQGKH